MSKAGEVAAAVGIGLGVTIATVGVIAAAVVCPEAFTTPRATPPGVPAVRVQSGQPITIYTVTNPCGPTIRVPSGYSRTSVRIGNTVCPVVTQNGQPHIIYNGCKRAVIYD